MEIEIWKDVVGYEGFYQVSNLGRVKSVDRTVPYPNSKYLNGTGTRKFYGKILTLTNDGGGYSKVTLRKSGNQVAGKVHRLVAEAFLVKPDGKDYVNHKDGIRTNNNAENLEWCTSQENAQHAASRGTMGQKGEDAHRAKITEEVVFEIRSMYGSGEKIIRIAELFNLRHNHIESIVKRRSWRHI